MARLNPGRTYVFIVLWLIALSACIAICCLSLSNTSREVLPVFASYRLAITYGITSIPFAYLLAGLFRLQWQPHRFAFILSVVFTLLLLYALEPISWTLKQIESGFMVRSLIRCALSISLVLSWLVSFPHPLADTTKRAWTWTFLFCFAFPSIYAWKQTELCRDEFDSSLAGMRTSVAFNALVRYLEIAGPDSRQGVEFEDWNRKLRKEIAQAERTVAIPIPKDANVDDYLQRAMQLLSLSRNTEAEKVLLEARTRDPQVLLLLAISAREQKDNRKVESRCRQLLAEAGSNFGDCNPLAFQLLGESLIGQRKIQAAIATYELAIDQCKQHRSEFEMRLGRLLGEAGNTSSAIDHFKRAASIEPKLSVEVKKRIRGLQNNSCHP